jgi:hypothetical protein
MTARKRLYLREIIHALDATGGLRGAAAKRLGVSPATLRRRMHEFEFDDYKWDLSLKHRIFHEYQADTLRRGRKEGGSSARLFLKAIDWGLEEINEPQRLSDKEVKDLLKEWEALPTYDYVSPGLVPAATRERIARRGRKRTRRRASRGRRSAVWIKGTA